MEVLRGARKKQPTCSFLICCMSAKVCVFKGNVLRGVLWKFLREGGGEGGVYLCIRQNYYTVSHITDGRIPVLTLGQVLSFFTGAEYPPPLGFDLEPMIRFSTVSDFPLASRCALELTLPTKFYNDYTMFKEKMIYGLCNHGGFGLL